MSMRSARLKTVIRQVDPAIERRRWLRYAGVVLVAMGVGFLAGRELTRSDGVPLEDPGASLRSQVERLQTRAQVDRSTIGQLRVDLAESRARADELGRELVFYRGVVAPEELEAELVLREPTLVRGASAGEWRYQLVVQQGARTDSVRRGDLSVSITGTQEGTRVSLDLAALDGELVGDALPLNFRYFQRFNGVLSLPEGFVPEVLVLQAELVKPRSVSVEKRFDWPGEKQQDQPAARPEE